MYVVPCVKTLRGIANNYPISFGFIGLLVVLNEITKTFKALKLPHYGNKLIKNVSINIIPKDFMQYRIDLDAIKLLLEVNKSTIYR